MVEVFLFAELFFWDSITGIYVGRVVIGKKG
jgi:hypothetical protein